jgi:hypothetical protein
MRSVLLDVLGAGDRKRAVALIEERIEGAYERLSDAPFEEG